MSSIYKYGVGTSAVLVAWTGSSRLFWRDKNKYDIYEGFPKFFLNFLRFFVQPELKLQKLFFHTAFIDINNARTIFILPGNIAGIAWPTGLKRWFKASVHRYRKPRLLPPYKMRGNF